MSDAFSLQKVPYLSIVYFAQTVMYASDTGYTPRECPSICLGFISILS
jgi:hypothetical protein